MALHGDEGRYAKVRNEYAKFRCPLLKSYLEGGKWGKERFGEEGDGLLDSKHQILNTRGLSYCQNE